MILEAIPMLKRVQRLVIFASTKIGGQMSTDSLYKCA